MKKLLLILLLIVGCEESTTESSVDPLVGIWEGVEITSVGNGTTIIISLGENTQFGSVTWILGSDGVASVTSTDSDGTEETDNGIWSATGNKLTIIKEAKTYIDDNITINYEEETTIYDFSLNGDILEIFELENGVETTLKFERQ